jgi:hypothetical protein
MEEKLIMPPDDAPDGYVTLDQGPWIGLPDECRCRFALTEHTLLGVVLYTQLSPWRDQGYRSPRLRRALEKHRRCFAEKHGIDYDRATLVPGKCDSFDDVIVFAKSIKDRKR